jgi:hypothetical protein
MADAKPNGAADERGVQVPDAGSDMLGQPFTVESISEVAPPDGAEGVWHQYVIVQGTNRINGLRPGTLTVVRPQIEEMVRHLNERFMKAQNKPTGGYSRRVAYTPKPAQ